MQTIILGLVIPFAGTVLGSTLVFFLKDKLDKRIEKILAGFAAGVMFAASIWSLLIPALNMSPDLGKMAWLPVVIGFLVGMAFLLIIDSIVPHLHMNCDQPEGVKCKLKKETMMFFAITLHNIPEGLAVGVVLAGVYFGQIEMTAIGALSLSIGIAIQNFPEGAIVAMPLKVQGSTKTKAFTLGVLSGVVEPIAALIAISLSSFVITALPYLLSFAAGAMIYVVIEELIPQAQTGEHSNWATVSFAIGFALMMVLDIALG